MGYHYKAQELVVPMFGEKYWCDISPIYTEREHAQERIDSFKSLDQSGWEIEAFRIVRRPIPDWEEITVEVVSHDND